MKPENTGGLYKQIHSILQEARQSAYRAVNFAMVLAYWEIGKRIVEHEQGGNAKASYGEGVLKELSQKLTTDFGKGFDERELRRIRQFYQTFPIRDAVRPELSWTHYRLLLKVENEKARNYYLTEAIAQNWSTRALERQMASFYYERILSSKKDKAVMEEAQKATEALAALPEDFIKDPYVLEFLSLPSGSGFLERDLESAVMQKLQQFLLELGKGFSFVAQQKRISAGDDHFYVDLVFYNYILKCFVLIDLKLGKLSHQDIGQMDLYVRWFEENMKTPSDNPTIGIILCSEKNETIVKYSVLKESKQLFASKYKLFLPTEAELIKEVEQELLHYKIGHNR
ncbi:MAG TPA: PDDEXK nuclease domain-containing protein [Chitinophagaceae bacterium]|nr:PDDEXK nuclease domain-containing protein [Chitinophagaceae bacterium]